MAYSEDFITDALAALGANDGNVARTAREVGVGRSTLAGWRDQAEAPENERQEAVSEKVAPKKEALADRVDALAHKILDVLPGKLDEASARDLSTSLGIAIDKARLLRGEATNITENRAEGAKDRVRQRIDRIAAAQRN